MKTRLISLIFILIILNTGGLFLMQQQRNQAAIIPTLAQLVPDAVNLDLLASAGIQNAVEAVQPTALPVKPTIAPDAVMDTVVVQFAAETSPVEQVTLIEAVGGVVQAQDTQNHTAVIQTADSIETIVGLETSPLVIAAAPQSSEVVSSTDEPIIITQAQIQPPPKPIDQLLATAREEGSARVIVMLNVQTYAESSISARGVSAQRANIRFRQTQLVNRVAQFRTHVDVLYDVIPAIAMTVDEAALQYLAASPDVLTIEEDRLHTVDLASSIPVVGADTVWANGYTGAGQTIAILDTGVDLDHPFLSGRIVAEACFSTTNSEATTLCPNGLDSQTGTGSANAMTAACLNSGVSICDHGSHVAGIAAGNDDANGNGVSYYGVAPDANIIAIQVFHRNTNPLCTGGICTYDSDYLAALQYVYNLRTTYDIAAANLSLGGGQYFAACDSAAPSILSIANQLWAANIATVASSGNNGFTSSMGHPACVSTIVSVGNSTDSDGVASSSNVASFMDLFAPGSSITSSIPNNTYAVFSGTSMAAPHVAGAFALMGEAVPDASVEDMLSALETTGLLVTDTRFGAPGNITIPRIRIDAAIDALIGSVANDDFDNARLISSLPYTHSVNTTNATVAVDDPLSTCDVNPGKTVWYQYTPSASVNVTFDTIGSGFNTVLSVWTGTRGNLIPVACNDDTGGTQSQVSLSLVNGITYTIMVAGYNGAEGSLVFNAKLQPPTNDLIANAITIPSLSYSNQQVTTTATNESLTGCSGTGIGSTIWYKYTAPITATVVFDTFGSNYDTVLGLYTGSVANPTYLTCNDDSGGLQSQVTYTLTANTTYYIRIGGYTGATGNLTFNATLQLTTFCNSVTDIPLSECQALHRFYLYMDGANWQDDSGWLVSTQACTWYGVTCDATPRVTHLVMDNNLSYYLYFYIIPSDIRYLQNLRELSLASALLGGDTYLPPELGSLHNLETLNLSGIYISPGLPAEIGYLGNLRTLNLSLTGLPGLPSQIGFLRNLQTLDLTMSYVQSLPVELGNLSNLQVLEASYTGLTSIPAEIGNLNNLQVLNLHANGLTALPATFGNLTSLQVLDLYANELSGSIPLELINFSNLTYLDMSYNNLSGTIPPELGTLSYLEHLNLRGNYDLTGNIPPELGNLSNLQFLSLGVDDLVGTIPPQLGNLTNLQILELSGSNLTGSIPPELGNLINLEFLTISAQEITGSIPPELGNLTNLRYLRIAHNPYLEGSLPPELGNLVNLEEMWINHTAISGAIPPEFGNLSSLTQLVLFYNQLSGPIPDTIGNLSNLMSLSLDNNQLIGTIPASIGNLTNIRSFYVDNNQLSGPIPNVFNNIELMHVIGVYNNYLTGEIPSSLMGVENIQDIIVNTNCLYSTDPAIIAFVSSVDTTWQTTQNHCYYEPYGLTYDGDGDLFIANEGGQGSFVAILGADDVVRTAANSFLGAADVAFNSSGVLHVADDSNAIYQVDGAGTVTTFIAAQTGIDNPNAIAFDSSDNLYILNAVGNLAKFDSAGSPINVNFATGFSSPQGLAVFGNTVFVSDATGTIYTVDGTTGAVSTYATTSYATQGGLTVDSLGNLFMAAYDAGSVISVTAFDQSIITCISGLSQPRGLALNGTSQIAVSSHNTHQVAKHDLCDLPPTENVAEVTLQIVELDAEPGILLDEAFEIEVFIHDIRAATSGQAVLEGYLDVLFDEAFVQVNSITYDADYTTSQTGTIGIGLVDEVGATGGSSPAADGRIFTLHLTAVGVGTTSISTQSASNPASHVRLYDYLWDVRDWTIHDSINLNIAEIQSDLVATSFDAQPDHVLAGQTSINFTVTNQGNRPATATTASVVLSDDATLGNGDDVLVTTIDVPALAVDAEYTATVALSLPVATLYTHAANEDAIGQAVGTLSSNIDMLALVLDLGNTLNEWEEGNNTATDDITYFGWDNNADMLVSPLDAIFAINRLGGAVPPANMADTDGSVQVDAADVNAIVDRFGYARNTTVDEIPATPPVITASSGNVQVRLVPNNSSAANIYMMGLGDTFDLNLYVEDVRGITPQSVYAAYTDLYFNPAVVQVTGMTYSADFTKLQLGTVDNVNGIISNLGAAASSFTPSSNTLLVTVHFAISGYGNTSITTGAADHALAHTTIYGDDNAQNITQAGGAVLWVRPMPTATATPTSAPVPTQTPTPMIQTVGLFSNGTWTFRDSNTNGAADVRFQFGSTEAGWLPLVGDWDGDDVDGIGVYRNGTFILRDTSSAGTIEYVVTLGIAESGWQPVAGDWDGDGRDTVGLYKNGLWLLTNVHQRNAPVAYRVSFNPFGAVSSAVLAGDWNSDGRDSVGLYFNGSFTLLNHVTGTPSVTSFSFGPRESGWLPLAGDWDGDGRDTIGIYKDSLWRLRNNNSAGVVDIGFTFRGLGVPVANYRGGMVTLAALAVAPAPTATPITAFTASPTWMPTLTMIAPEVTIVVEPSAEATLEVQPSLELTVDTSPTATPVPTEIPPQVIATETATLPPAETTQEATGE